MGPPLKSKNLRESAWICFQGQESKGKAGEATFSSYPQLQGIGSNWYWKEGVMLQPGESWRLTWAWEGTLGWAGNTQHRAPAPNPGTTGAMGREVRWGFCYKVWDKAVGWVRGTRQTSGEVRCQRRISRSEARDSYSPWVQHGSSLQGPSEATRLETEVLGA